MTSPDELPNPLRHELQGDNGGVTHETPLTLGPDSDHADDPNRGNSPRHNEVPDAPLQPHRRSIS